jgi:hydroxymethylbilane synthase
MSELALWQTHHVRDLIKSVEPNLTFEIVSMETIGDKVLDRALSKIGDKSLFTKELETALVANAVDIVVHSLKDLPTQLPPGLVIGCICSRESPQDAVVMCPRYRGCKLKDLPAGSMIGTSSVRRVAQLKRRYPHLQFTSVRGNLNTRFLKLDDPTRAASEGKGDGTEYHALILALAGVERLGMRDRVDEVLSNEDCMYAVGQGALAVECREHDSVVLNLLSRIHDEKSALTCLAERSLMRALRGGCSTPVAVYCDMKGDWNMHLTASVLSVDGEQEVQRQLSVTLPLVMPYTASLASTTTRKRSATESTNLLRALQFQDPADIDEVLLTESRDPDEIFIGLKVAPICDIGRLRMACARRCGDKLAKLLLEAGADVILAEILKDSTNHAPEPLLPPPRPVTTEPFTATNPTETVTSTTFCAE